MDEEEGAGVSSIHDVVKQGGISIKSCLPCSCEIGFYFAWKTSKFRNPEHLLSPDQRDGNNKSVLNNAFLSNSTIMKLINGSVRYTQFYFEKV